MLALIALTACGKKGARRSDFDSATAAALASGVTGTPLAEQPKVAHVAGFDLGHQLDRRAMIFGGPALQFAAGDSVLLSIRGQFIPAGADISVRIRQKKATIDSAGTTAGAPDSAGVSYSGVRFASDRKKWTKGAYQAEVFLNGKFQMSQEFTIVR